MTETNPEGKEVELVYDENAFKRRYFRSNPGAKLWTVPVAAFGIRHVIYRDDRPEAWKDFSMANQIAVVRYKPK